PCQPHAHGRRHRRFRASRRCRRSRFGAGAPGAGYRHQLHGRRPALARRRALAGRTGPPANRCRLASGLDRAPAAARLAPAAAAAGRAVRRAADGPGRAARRDRCPVRRLRARNGAPARPCRRAPARPPVPRHPRSAGRCPAAALPAPPPLVEAHDTAGRSALGRHQAVADRAAWLREAGRNCARPWLPPERAPAGCLRFSGQRAALSRLAGAGRSAARTLERGARWLRRFPVEVFAPQRAGRLRPDGIADRGDVLRRSAAAAAHDVDQPFGRELAQQPRRDFRCLVEAGLAHRIGQAGVRIAADEGVAGGPRQFLDVRTHQCRAQRAVQADGQRPRMPHAVPERGHRLAAQDAPGRIGHGAAHDKRQALARLLEIFVDGEQGRLRIERVEDRLDQQQVDPALDQSLDLFVIGRAQLLEVDVARPRVVHVGADAGGLGRGAQCARDEARLVPSGKPVGGRAREPGRGQIHLARQVAEGIVVLRDARGAEGVGLDDVGPGREVALVDVADHVGPRQAEQLAVVFQVLGVILEALPAVVALGQPEPLDHRAHCAVENRDALREQARQGLATGVDDRFHDHCIVGSGNVPAFFPGTIRAILPSSAPAPGSILHEVFGYEQFRGPQAAIVDHVIAGGDALVLMPTGGGKSLCYQIPAIARQRAGLGVTVVVSPLIALMHDQVGALHEAGVEAQFLNSSLSVEEANAVERRMLRGDLTLLYAAPERVTTPRFLAQLDSLHERGKLSLFAIDEAHCVSQWGHDFRPEYRALTVLHERYVSVPRIALTATADAITRADILERLQLGQARQFISSFDRPNIHYTIVEKNDATAQLLRFIEADHEGAAGIVYCQTRKRVEEIA